MSNGTLIAHDAHCTSCGARCAQQDRFCRQCGSSLMIQLSQTAAQPREIVPKSNPLDNRFIVIGILCCVGPLGLPALWLSSRFSRITKIIVTAVFLVLTTVVPLAVAWYWLEVAVQPVLESLRS